MNLVKYRFIISDVVVLFFACLLFQTQLCRAQESLTFGDFVRAHGISIDPQGSIYIADAGTNKIQKFTSEGKLIAEIGGYGWGQLEFDQPYDVCAANGLDVFVADYGNHRIQRYNRKLEYIATLYTRNSTNETHRFGYPTGIAVNRFGDLFLCDQENRRVLKVSGFTRVMSSIGGIDAGKGKLFDPMQVEVDTNDNMYVLERKRIVVFDNFGNYIRTIGADTLRAASGFAIFSRRDGFPRSSIFVAGGNGVIEFTLDGKIADIMQCSEMESSGQECVDVAADDSRLIVLFRHFAVILSR